MRKARPDRRRVSGGRRWMAFALVLTATGCAAGAAPELPGPERIAELEAAVRGGDADDAARLRLAAAYQRAGRAADAAAVVEPVLARDASNAAATFQLALAYEDMERFAEARRLYEAYLPRSGSPELRRRVRGRLALLERRELEAAVRVAIAREQELAGADPPPQTVGVFPFLTPAASPLRPLGRALSELLTTDLSQTERLRVLERSQVQHLLDEIERGEAGALDPATAARAGRLLGAGRIVQGRIDGTEADVRMQALVVPVGGARDTAGAPAQQQGALSALFDMQAALSLELYRRLGVELTVAERARVLQRPTENVQALLAFGFGLESEDGARWAEAAEHYRRAVALDPGFEEARTRQVAMESLATAAEETPEELALYAALEWSDVASWIRLRQRYAGVDRMVASPGIRDATVEILGLEGLERVILIDLTIRRPGGRQ